MIFRDPEPARGALLTGVVICIASDLVRAHPYWQTRLVRSDSETPGPSIIDTIANAALFYGLITNLAARAQAPEAQLSFAQARENFYSAAKDGLAAQITWLGGGQGSVRDLLLDRLLPLARRALERSGLSAATLDRYLGVIEQRVRTGRTGAAWQRSYVAKHGKDMPSLVGAYRTNLRSGAPVHEWEL